jgi:hypothetical protein
MGANMNRKKSSASNPNPNTSEDSGQKAEAVRRGAESSRAAAESPRTSAKARRERAEQERIASEDSRQVAEVDRRDAEELRRGGEEFRQAAEETRAAAEDIRTATQEAKEVLEEAKQAQKSGEVSDTEDEVGGGASWQLQMEQMPGYLAARFTGVAMPGEASRQFGLIAEHCKLTYNNKLLVDATGLEIIKPSVTDRFIFGERLVIFALLGVKVACVSRPELIDPQKFGILVARNRGVKVEVFTDLQAAEGWLLK